MSNEFEDEVLSSPAGYSLLDLWGIAGPLLATRSEEDQDELLANLAIDCQGCLVDIARKGQRWALMKPGAKKETSTEALGAEISAFLVRISAVAYLQGQDLEIEEESVRDFVEEWPEIHKNDFILAVNLGQESTAALMLEYYCDPNDPVAEAIEEGVLEQNYATLIGVCMVLCDRFQLDFGTVLWNACIQTEI